MRAYILYAYIVYMRIVQYAKFDWLICLILQYGFLLLFTDLYIDVHFFLLTNFYGVVRGFLISSNKSHETKFITCTSD